MATSLDPAGDGASRTVACAPESDGESDRGADRGPVRGSTPAAGPEAGSPAAMAPAPSAALSPQAARPAGEALRPAVAASAPDADAEGFWNLPNTITALRAAVVPVLLLHPLFPGEVGSAVMAWIFIAAAVSDLVDGWLARRGQQVTHVGKLLDPLADKLLVSTALIVVLAMGRIPAWAVWMVVTIVGRELAVTGLRGIASAGGQVMAASGLGKLKTVAQNVAIGALLFHYETIGLSANTVGLVFLAIATALTIASGYRYFAEYFRELHAGRPGGDGS